jgi:hypothetical protein
MKGDKSRKASRFKAHNVPWNRGLKMASYSSEDTRQQLSTTRMTADEFSMVSKLSADGRSFTTPDFEGNPGNVRLLRPKSKKTSDLASKEDDTFITGMRFIDIEKNSAVFNEVFQSHQHQSKDCIQANMTVAEEHKVGVCVKFSLKCTNCDYISPVKKLYKEAPSSKRGPKPAAANIALATALQDTPMGNTKCRYLLANMDVPPPSRTSMQRTSNRVSKAIKTLNDRDMSAKVQLIKDVNNKRGHAENIINVAIDGRYNSTSITSRKKAGQNASQSIGIACETVTGKQYIIASALQNKLCWSGAWLRNQGFEVTCPGGHEDCTANIHPQAPLSEYELGREIGEQLRVQGAFIKYATTDGDSRSAAGVAQAMKILDPMWKVERLADPTHLGQAQFRQCYSAKFSSEMFSGKTREKRQEQQRALSQDVKARSSLVLKELTKTYAGDIRKIKMELPNVLRATVSCYAGDCSSCRRHSYVCSGGASNNWWNRSMFLATHKITNLQMNDKDKHLLQEILKMKLSISALDEMKLGTSTQKCEAVNRSISVSLPKNVNYSRNVHGRLSSTIHRLNNGLCNSAVEKLSCMGVTLSPKPLRSLKKMEQEQEYQKSYAKRPETVKRRLLCKGQQLREHLKYKKTNKTTSDYSKGCLDPVPSTSRGGNCEHSYSQ